MLALLLAAQLAAAPASAFSSPAGPLDAVAAAPRHHQVLLENDEVRVLRVTLAPGETEPPHSHPWPSVMLISKSSALIDITYEDAGRGRLREVSRISLPAGPPPPALYGGPEGPHAIQNIGTEPFEAIRVEMKR